MTKFGKYFSTCTSVWHLWFLIETPQQRVDLFNQSDVTLLSEITVISIQNCYLFTFVDDQIPELPLSFVFAFKLIIIILSLILSAHIFSQMCVFTWIANTICTVVCPIICLPLFWVFFFILKKLIMLASNARTPRLPHMRAQSLSQTIA